MAMEFVKKLKKFVAFAAFLSLLTAAVPVFAAAGATDSVKSRVSADRLTAKANGEMTVNAEVHLRDSANKPVANHRVELISSRSHDHVEATDLGLTDGNGKARFAISSSMIGISTFTAIDLTDSTVLDSRLEVVFYGEDTTAIGGDRNLVSFIPTARAQSISGGPVSEFEITDIKEPVKANDNVTFTVKAVDDEGNVSENYAGEVRFSVEGAGANDVVLPKDYQFTAEDLGVHTFSLGLSFKNPGSYVLTVTDVNKITVRGEKSLSVAAAGSAAGSNSGSSAASSSAAGVTITSPRDGTYNKSSQTISGRATPGIALKVFDNDQEIGGTDADAEGSFSFQATQLSDGAHEFKVVELDGNNQTKSTSSIVKVNIDTTAPDAESVTFEPSGPVAPDSLVKVTVISGGNLAQAAMLVNDDLVVLTEDLGSPGTYKGSFVAPKEAGTFSVDLILVDSLGNESQLKDQKQLVVAVPSGADATDSLDDDPDADAAGDSTDQVQVSAVTGVKAFSGDGRVNLEWSPAGENIKNYKVYYGTRADELANSVETFAADTKWYVPNLDNETEYFFALTAIDVEGNESAVRSEIVSAVPFQVTDSGAVATDEGDRLFGFEDGAASVVGSQPAELHAAAADQPALDKTGPEMYGIALLSLLAAWVWRRRQGCQV